MVRMKQRIKQTMNTTLTIVLLFALLAISADATQSNLPDPFQAGWQGERVCEVLENNQHHRVLRCTFPPGVGHERHFHPPHFGYAIAGGQMRITDQNGVREVNLTTGSSFSSTGVAWHEVLNVGDATVVYLIVEPKLQSSD